MNLDDWCKVLAVEWRKKYNIFHREEVNANVCKMNLRENLNNHSTIKKDTHRTGLNAGGF